MTPPHTHTLLKKMRFNVLVETQTNKLTMKKVDVFLGGIISNGKVNIFLPLHCYFLMFFSCPNISTDRQYYSQT